MMMVLAAAGVTSARAQEGGGGPLPPVGEVVAHARAVMDKNVKDVVCKVVVDTQLLDKTGKIEHDEHREGKATLHGDDQDIESSKVVRDGQPMTADQLADERNKVQRDKQKSKKKKSSDDDFDVMSPLSSKNVGEESFELLRREILWGRPTYVLKVTAKKHSPQQANGTLWIDAERFVELKGELVPSEMPAHADWIKVQEQYVSGPQQIVVPSLLHIEGAGHMMFMHKQFRTTLRWSECR